MEVWVIGAAAAVAVLTAVVFRGLLPAPVVVAVLAGASGALGWGVIRLRPDPSTLEVALTVLAMAVLGPVHVRVLLGPFGPR